VKKDRLETYPTLRWQFLTGDLEASASAREIASCKFRFVIGRKSNRWIFPPMTNQKLQMENDK
jgi:hypothetical protein